MKIHIIFMFLSRISQDLQIEPSFFLSSWTTRADCWGTQNQMIRSPPSSFPAHSFVAAQASSFSYRETGIWIPIPHPSSYRLIPGYSREKIKNSWFDKLEVTAHHRRGLPCRMLSLVGENIIQSPLWQHIISLHILAESRGRLFPPGNMLPLSLCARHTC